MKIQLTLKDPDGVYDSIEDFIEDNIPEVLSDEEKESLKEERREKLNTQLSKFIKFGEYITIEIDLDANTSKVLENK